MSLKIPANLRVAAAERAGNRCEYCHLPAGDSFYGFHIDHIISKKHSGETVLGNLACSCPDCNRNKGTDLGTYLDDNQQLVRFFNPRIDVWKAHFELLPTGVIHPRTEIAEATVKILQINHPDRIIERKLLMRLDLLP